MVLDLGFKRIAVSISSSASVQFQSATSTEGVTRFLPGVAGFLDGTRTELPGCGLEHPQRPFAAIVAARKCRIK